MTVRTRNRGCFRELPFRPQLLQHPLVAVEVEAAQAVVAEAAVALQRLLEELPRQPEPRPRRGLRPEVEVVVVEAAAAVELLRRRHLLRQFRS